MISVKRQERLTVDYDSSNRMCLAFNRGVEILDGADLALIRDVIEENRMLQTEFIIDLAAVSFLPSGFFGLLYNFHEEGLRLFIKSPLPQIENMTWFKMYFQPIGDGVFLLNDTDMKNVSSGDVVHVHKMLTGRVGEDDGPLVDLNQEFGK